MKGPSSSLQAEPRRGPARRHRAPRSLRNRPSPVLAQRVKRWLYRGYYRSSELAHRWKRLLTPVGWFALSGLAACGLLGVDTQQAMAFQAFCLLASLWMVALIFQVRLKMSCEVRRDLPRFGSVGVPLTYRVELVNNLPRAGRGLTIVEALPDARPSLREFLDQREPREERRNAFDRAFGYYRWTWLLRQNRMAEVSEKFLPDLPPKTAVQVTLELTPQRRGLLQLEALQVGNRDPFGFTRRFASFPRRQSLLILPKRYRIPPRVWPGALEYQRGGVALASSVGQSDEFVSLRDYRQGDPPRHVHWRTAARTHHLVVKEFQDEFFVRHALILDTFLRGGNPELLEEAVSVAASLGCTLEDQESLLDLVFVGPQAYCFTMGRGLGRAEQLLEILASVKPCASKPFSDLENLVVEHASGLSGAICVFLAWDPARQGLVRKLRGMGIPLLVLVLVEPPQPFKDSGVMKDRPGGLRFLEIGQVQEGLMSL